VRGTAGGGTIGMALPVLAEAGTGRSDLSGAGFFWLGMRLPISALGVLSGVEGLNGWAVDAASGIYPRCK